MNALLPVPSYPGSLGTELITYFTLSSLFTLKFIYSELYMCLSGLSIGKKKWLWLELKEKRGQFARTALVSANHLDFGCNFVLIASEEEGNGINAGQAYNGIDDSANGCQLPAKDGSNQIVLKESDEAPVDCAYNNEYKY